MTRLHAHARAFIQRVLGDAICLLRHEQNTERHGDYLITRCRAGCAPSFKRVSLKSSRAAVREANAVLRRFR